MTDPARGLRRLVLVLVLDRVAERCRTLISSWLPGAPITLSSSLPGIRSRSASRT